MRVCQTLDQIEQGLAQLPSDVIAIDGFPVSGKTSLAKALSLKLNLPVISADDYLKKNRGSFFEHLKINEISEKVATHGRCIIEGICCLRILQAITVKADALIYVKCMRVNGWVEQDRLDAYLRCADDPAAVMTAVGDPIQLALQNIWREVARYHSEFYPHKIANLLFERRAP